MTALVDLGGYPYPKPIDPLRCPHPLLRGSRPWERGTVRVEPVHVFTAMPGEGR